MTPSTTTTRKRAPRTASNTTTSKKRRVSIDSTPSAAWRHTPSTTTLLWLAVSLPLVVWDTGYVFGRPHTMPGGNLHWPLWAPYELYGKVDHVYGFKSWESHSGFTGAQSALNTVESLMYVVYLWLVWRRADSRSTDVAARRTLSGRDGALAVLIGFSAAVMTLSKTVLYCKRLLTRLEGHVLLTTCEGPMNTTAVSIISATTRRSTSFTSGCSPSESPLLQVTLHY